MLTILIKKTKLRKKVNSGKPHILILICTNDCYTGSSAKPQYSPVKHCDVILQRHQGSPWPSVICNSYRLKFLGKAIHLPAVLDSSLYMPINTQNCLLIIQHFIHEKFDKITCYSTGHRGGTGESDRLSNCHGDGG